MIKKGFDIVSGDCIRIGTWQELRVREEWENEISLRITEKNAEGDISFLEITLDKQAFFELCETKFEFKFKDETKPND